MASLLLMIHTLSYSASTATRTDRFMGAHTHTHTNKAYLQIRWQTRHIPAHTDTHTRLLRENTLVHSVHRYNETFCQKHILLINNLGLVL